jgi:hypothetical protein
MFSFSATCNDAGAIIVEDMGERNVKEATLNEVTSE